jgi:protein involved in polysaccharide export with SLBB domain
MALCLLVPMADSADATQYRLDSGDVLRVTILNQPQLGASYTVGDDGSIALPGFDRIAVAGLSLAEATAALRAALDETLVDPAVAIQVETYRPFYVMGDVARPGMYPSQPGLGLLEAVAIAGGYKATSAYFEAAITGIRAVESRSIVRQKLFEARVQVARLEAELVDAESFAMDIAGEPTWAEEILRREREALKLSTTAFKNELELLERERKLREDEIAALEERIQTHAELAELQEEELSKVQDLVERGVATVSRLNEQRREQLRTRSDALQMTVLLNQARQAKVQLDLRLSNLTRDRRLQSLSDLRKLKAEIASFIQRLGADEAVILESDAAQYLEAGERLRTLFTIRRNDGSELRATDTANIEVQPGDVVLIDRTLVRTPTADLAGSGPSPAPEWAESKAHAFPSATR